MRGNLNLTDPETRSAAQRAIMGLQNTYVKIKTGVILLPQLQPHAPALHPVSDKAATAAKKPSNPQLSSPQESPQESGAANPPHSKLRADSSAQRPVSNGRTVRLSVRERMLLAAQQAADALTNTNRSPARDDKKLAAQQAVSRRARDEMDAAPGSSGDARRQVRDGLARLHELRDEYDSAARCGCASV